MELTQNYKYHFDASLGVLFKYYYGEISVTDISSSWKYAFDNNLIPKETKGFVIDYTNASFAMEVQQHNLIADFYRDHIEEFDKCKIAVITLNPKDIVIPILVGSKNLGCESQPFSTLEAAIEWVLK
ncbi:hypothetical protein EC396_06340 [Lutibacter sp. HS1-25]|uniref:hypothetical protein n=1 Tax=Lutibacter sp. HS1-25 TaxID=2485000 RepID=UPI0010119801|nr:hypothetical protein [Lutibacter sp. HS1-25]RXP57896.1 hypothetical protein EC396_06340 [Lutibacter sp. HS1-25]